MSDTRFGWRLRSMRASDAPLLTGLLAQLGYPSEPAAVADRVERILNSGNQHVLVALPADDSRIAGYISVEPRLMLQVGERAEITGLVVDSAARRCGLGRALVDAAEQWALQHGLHAVVVRSNVARSESHPFYEKIGYQRAATSHMYRKDV